MSESSAPSPLEMVQGAYSAFGRGDIPALLSNMADDFEWDSRYPPLVPFGGVWKGHDGVLKMLQALNGAAEVQNFQVHEFIAGTDKVVVLGFDDSLVKATGRTYHNEWVHVWATGNGQLLRIATYNDTAATVAAFVTAD